MSGQFPPKKLSVAILSSLCYLQRRLTGLIVADATCAAEFSSNCRRVSAVFSTFVPGSGSFQLRYLAALVMG